MHVPPPDDPLGLPAPLRERLERTLTVARGAGLSLGHAALMALRLLPDEILDRCSTEELSEYIGAAWARVVDRETVEPRGRRPSTDRPGDSLTF